MQVAAPLIALTVPGAQGVSVAEPILHDVPALQVMHWLTLTITARDVSLRVPPGHGSGFDEPSGQ